MINLYDFINILPPDQRVIIYFKYPDNMRAMDTGPFVGAVRDVFYECFVFDFNFISADYYKEYDIYRIRAELKEECTL